MNPKYDKLIKQEQSNLIVKKNKLHKVVLVYPNSYFVGMSSIGFQHIYFFINEHPFYYADRAFFEKEEIVSFETNKPLKNFEMIFFSISYELDYINFVKILKQSKIPLNSSERGSNYPLIIVGGACTFFNPEPIADFVDIFIVGEAEETLSKLLDIYNSNEYKDKDDFYCAIKDIQGMYIPKFYNFAITSSDDFAKNILRQHIDDISLLPAHSHIITPNTEFSNMLVCEISRGCANQCKFCMVRNVYGKLRHQDKNVILQIAEKFKTFTNKIGLVAPTPTNYPDIIELSYALFDMGYKISFSSLRLDNLTVDIINILVKSNQKTITLAPETGSEKLRYSIGKNISNAKIIEIIKNVLECGITNIKLYFMIGLPEETFEDIKDIENLIKEIRSHYVFICASKGRIGKIIININPFVPKPFTQFECYAFENIFSLKQKYKYLTKTIRPLSNIELNFESLDDAKLQALLSRGDRRVGELLNKISNIHNPL